ncbi:signal peptidase I [bacterium]|nr:signal peptidase I [bacterium]
MYEQVQEQKTPLETLTSILAGIGSFIFSSIEAIVVALAISVVLYLFFMTPHEVVGTSMFPTYHNGEHLIANKVIYRLTKPVRGDVVIFKYSNEQDFIKRIIGMPGDTVSLRDGRYYINGILLDESKYLDSTVYTSGGEFLHEGEEVEIPLGMYFVSGDNRPHSSDSRAFGPIEEQSIKGKVWLIYYPLERFRFAEHVKYEE